ncbi:unnamed protein product [Scytosiphon promiscuus]
MAEPAAAEGRPPEGERNGMSFSTRMLLMAMVYLFIKRYIGDGSAERAPTKSETTRSPGIKSARDVPVAPLTQGLPSRDGGTRPVLGGVDDADEEFSGLGRPSQRSGGGEGQRKDEELVASTGGDASSSAAVQQVPAIDTALTNGVGGRGVPHVPHVLVQFCVS